MHSHKLSPNKLTHNTPKIRKNFEFFFLLQTEPNCCIPANRVLCGHLLAFINENAVFSLYFSTDILRFFVLVMQNYDKVFYLFLQLPKLYISRLYTFILLLLLSHAGVV